MVFCSKCGMKLPDNIRFCPSCGTQVKQERMLAYCRMCGNRIDEEAEICPRCKAQQMDYKQKNPKSGGNVLWALLGFLIPVVGAVLWFIWRQKRPKDSRFAGEGALAALVVYIAAIHGSGVDELLGYDLFWYLCILAYVIIVGVNVWALIKRHSLLPIILIIVGLLRIILYILVIEEEAKIIDNDTLWYYDSYSFLAITLLLIALGILGIIELIKHKKNKINIIGCILGIYFIVCSPTYYLFSWMIIEYWNDVNYAYTFLELILITLMTAFILQSTYMQIKIEKNNAR